MTTLGISLYATTTALIAVLGCFGISAFTCRNKSSTYCVATALLTLMTATGFLSLRTWLHWPWLTLLIWVALIIGAVVSTQKAIAYLAMAAKTSRDDKYSKKLTWLIFLTLALIGMEALWAALPLYRYDQWTYHLNIAKWIDKVGTLTGPMTYDQIFFTGSYEFIGLLPRAMWSNDFFQQGFQNSFSLLFVAIASAILIAGDGRASIQKLVLATAFGLMVIFGSGDHEALANSKPDYILMVTSLVVITTLCDRVESRRISPALLGSLMVSGLAYKITWLHFATAATPFCLIYAWKTARWDGIKKLSGGASLALIIVTPFLLKNWFFFGNPLHPAQTSIWHSKIWSMEFADYWQIITDKPLTAHKFIWNIPIISATLPERLMLIAVVIAGVVIYNKATASPQNQKVNFFRYTVLAGMTAIYILSWGVFYGPNIYNRFLSPLFAFGIALVWDKCRRREPSAILALLVLLPVFLNGMIEVTVQQLVLAAETSPVEFQDAFTKSPSAKNKVLREIETHRTVYHSGETYERASMISDYAFNFYGPSIGFIAADPITLWHLRQESIDPEKGCAANFFRKHDIRYLWSYKPENWQSWPLSIRKLTPSMTPLPVSMGEAWYVKDPSLLSCNKS